MIMEKAKSRLSTSMDAKLHDDEWIEILSRLPVKAVLRFKSVCKKWHSITSTPHFIRRHLHNSISSPRVFIPSPPRSYKTIGYYKHRLDVKELPRPKETSGAFAGTLIGTCDGLICYLDYNAKNQRTATSVCLWNPSLRVSRTLNLNVPIGLDRSILFFWFGRNEYGYDNEYKLILGVRTVEHKTNMLMLNGHDPIPYARENYKRTHHVHVMKPFAKKEDNYELSTQEIDQGIEMRASKDGGTLLRGVVHWLSYRARGGPCAAVFTYDLDKKVVGEMETPPDLDWYGSIGVIDGCLCGVMQGDYKGVFEIWMMKEYGVTESWTRWMVISSGSCARMSLFTRLVWVGATHNGDFLFSCGPGAELLVYNVSRMKAKTIVANGREHAKMYIESLVSP